jgi:DNA-binding NtrC family response regulator
MKINNRLIKYISNTLHLTDRELHIYIIEDNQYYAKLIKANLNKSGYNKIDIFYNGELALESIDKDKPNCIILDHILYSNGLNGCDVLKHVKKDHSNTDVIILSGQQDVKIASDLMKFGAFDYIVKNDMTFFNLDNALFKLSRILMMKDRNIIKYVIIFILVILLILSIIII